MLKDAFITCLIYTLLRPSLPSSFIFFILFYDPFSPVSPLALTDTFYHKGDSRRNLKTWGLRCKFIEYWRFKAIDFRKGSGDDYFYFLFKKKCVTGINGIPDFFILLAMVLSNRNQSELACCISPFHFSVGSVSVMCTVLKRVQWPMFNYFCHRHMEILLMFLCPLWFCTLFVYKAFMQTCFYLTLNSWNVSVREVEEVNSNALQRQPWHDGMTIYSLGADFLRKKFRIVTYRTLN